MDFMKHLYKTIPKNALPAPWWKRLGSLLIDIFIMSIILMPFQKFLPQNVNYNAIYSINDYLIASLVTIYFLVYVIIMQYLCNQTIGMILFNIKIKNNIKNDIKNNKRKNNEISLIQIIIRNLFLIPVFPFIILWIIDPVYLLLTDMRLSEKWSKTKTI